jgi:tetraacyldisaccharide 4'-kinase
VGILTKILLAPFSLLYGSGAWLRNYLYNKHFLRSIHFDVPVINVGNLSTGGTGKTPQVDYLINLLKAQYPVGMLSRGYRRSSSGYQDVNIDSTALEVGDEPLLIKWKHPEIAVAVSEDRATGIPSLVSEKPLGFTVILDDAFQHRTIRSGLNILLTPYNNLYTDDWILPMGNLREFRNGADRADIIIVSHAPTTLSKKEREQVVAKLAPKAYQHIFFSHIQYQRPYQVFQERLLPAAFNEKQQVVLLTGIANSDKMRSYLETQCQEVFERRFADHHSFTQQDIESVINTYNNIEGQEKIIVTTEKDLTRLMPFAASFNKAGVKLLCLPIKVNFVPEEKRRFDRAIHFFVEKTLEEYTKGEN